VIQCNIMTELVLEPILYQALQYLHPNVALGKYQGSDRESQTFLLLVTTWKFVSNSANGTFMFLDS
jgi:hypothetical protein